MLYKLKDCKNGFYIDESTTNQELDTLLTKYYRISDVRCIVCNSKMAKVFNFEVFGKRKVTINNKIEDRVFFINSKC